MNCIKFILTGVLFLIGLSQASAQSAKALAKSTVPNIPTELQGFFMDDYGIRYNISDSLWTQLPGIKYHVLSWDTTAQYLLARNDGKNPGEAGLYTRIDYMLFNNMEPFHWGFCLTVYDATSITEAREKAKADREHPKKGCNGYPFSRMKRTD